jgi:hypothetical protein
MPNEVDDAYSEMAAFLGDETLEELAKTATGKDIYAEWCARSDARKVKLKKIIAGLKTEGNERWLLTYILIYIAANENYGEPQERLSRKIVRAFPGTLVALPKADRHVTIVLERLNSVLTIPIAAALKAELRKKKLSFAEIVRRIVTLFAHKSLYEGLLQLILTLDYNNTLVTIDQIESLLDKASEALESLGDAAAEQRALLDELIPLVKMLWTAPSPDEGLNKKLQNLVRYNLARLGVLIFEAARELSFEPLISGLPEDVEDHPGFNDLVQAMRDLTTTILGRVLKNRMWQAAEKRMTLVSNFFVLSADTCGIDDWYLLRSKVEWLAALDPAESWSSDEKVHSDEIQDELTRADDMQKKLAKELELSDGVREHFQVYRNWFVGPFEKVSGALRDDVGSLWKIRDPITKILNELAG